ncbi:MAG TPA: DUF1080 domain-containing protein [Gemmataceae bacterium]|nr:DUF1080 domain-containing protein [Gemmataceae bacterium]
MQLFTGKDLAGWTIHPSEPNRKWAVNDGALTLDGSLRGHLFSTRDDIRDVHLRIEAKCEGNTSAIGVRVPFTLEEGGTVRCYGARLGTRDAFGPFTFGNASKELFVKRGEWFTQELILRKDKLTVKINGEEVQTLTAPLQEQRGRVVLSVLPGEAKFRKIEIKELPPD